MSDKKVSLWEKLFGEKKTEKNIVASQESIQESIQKAVDATDLGQNKDSVTQNSEGIVAGPMDSFFDLMKKECVKLEAYSVSAYRFSEEESKYLTSLSFYRGNIDTETPKAIALPQMVDDKIVEAIGSSAKTWGLESVIIPKTVIEIEIGFIDGVKRICFEPGSRFKRFIPAGWSAKSDLVLEEANFPEGADLTSLFLLPRAKEAPFVKNIPFDSDGFKRYGECIVDCNRALDVYDSKEDNVVWLQWVDKQYGCGRVIVRENVQEVYLPQGRCEQIGDFVVDGNARFGVEDGVFYQYSARKKGILHINQSCLLETLVIDKKTNSMCPIVSDHIKTVVIDSKIKVLDAAFDLNTIQTIVLKNPEVKLRSANFLHLEKGVTIYGAVSSLNGLKKGKNLIVKPLEEYREGQQTESISKKESCSSLANERSLTGKKAERQYLFEEFMATLREAKQFDNYSNDSVRVVLEGDEFKSRRSELNVACLAAYGMSLKSYLIQEGFLREYEKNKEVQLPKASPYTDFETNKSKTQILRYVGKEKDVVIPAGIKKIEEGAFKNSIIEKVSIESGSLLHRIGNFAFEDCIYLKTIDISAAQKVIIQTGAFKGCKALENIKGWEKIEKVAKGALEGACNIFVHDGRYIYPRLWLYNVLCNNSAGFTCQNLFEETKFSLNNIPKAEIWLPSCKRLMSFFLRPWEIPVPASAGYGGTVMSFTPLDYCGYYWEDKAEFWEEIDIPTAENIEFFLKEFMVTFDQTKPFVIYEDEQIYVEKQRSVYAETQRRAQERRTDRIARGLPASLSYDNFTHVTQRKEKEVAVKFLDGIELFYHCKYNVKVGDLVYVEGMREGVLGAVIRLYRVGVCPYELREVVYALSGKLTNSISTTLMPEAISKIPFGFVHDFVEHSPYSSCIETNSNTEEGETKNNEYYEYDQYDDEQIITLVRDENDDIEAPDWTQGQNLIDYDAERPSSMDLPCVVKLWVENGNCSDASLLSIEFESGDETETDFLLLYNGKKIADFYFKGIVPYDIKLIRASAVPFEQFYAVFLYLAEDDISDGVFKDCCVRVRFTDGRSYKYNTHVPVRTGDKVLVGGKREGEIGTVERYEKGWDFSKYMCEIKEVAEHIPYAETESLNTNESVENGDVENVWVKPIVVDDDYPFGYERDEKMIELINNARQGDKVAMRQLIDVYSDKTGDFYNEQKCAYWMNRSIK